MAQEGRAQLKTYFETGDKPTQAQFANLIDSCVNITDDGSPSAAESTSTQIDAVFTNSNETTPTTLSTSDRVSTRRLFNFWTILQAWIATNIYTKTESDDKYQKRYNPSLFANNGGTGNTFTATGSPTFTGSQPDFIILTFSQVAGWVPTGASTINIDGIGNSPLVRDDGTDLQAGDIIGGFRYVCAYSASVGYRMIGVGISGGSGGATNLGYTPSPTNGIVTSDTGTDATLTLVDGTNAGLASPAMKSTWDGKQNALGYTPENAANKGAASGYTPLNSSSKIDLTYLPDAILGQVLYGGQVDTSTAIATLTNNAKTKLGTGSATITLTNNTTAITGYVANEGIYYIVSTAGTFASISFDVGDWLISIGSAWKKVDNTDAISSFNTRTGAITLTSGDVTGALTYTPENVSNKDVSGGYAGLTLFKINFRNVANTFTSFFTNSNTAARTYTYQDRDGTIADNTDLATKFTKGGDTAAADLVFGVNSGNFGVEVKTNNLTSVKFLASPTSAVNYMTFKSSATGTGAIIGTVGDTGGVPLILDLNGLNGWLDIRNAGNADTNANVKMISMYDRLAGTERMAISYSVNNGMRLASAAGANYITIRAIAADQAVIPSALFLSGVVTTGPSGGSGTAAFSGIATTFSWSPTTNVAYKAYSVTSTINQTASGTGAVYGYEFAPTITANLGTVAAFRGAVVAGTNRYNSLNSGTAVNWFNGDTSIGVDTRTAILTIAGATTAKASLNIIAGTGPTTPNNNDLYATSTNLLNLYGKLAVRAGGDTNILPIVKVGGTVFDNFSDVSTTTSTSETDLYTNTLPASFFGTNGDKAFGKYSLQLTATGGLTKQVRAYFAGTLIFDSTALSISVATDYILNVYIIRESSSVVRVTVEAAGGTSAMAPKYTKITGLTLTSSQILKITGTVGTGAVAGDITAVSSFIDWKSAA